MMDTDVFYSHKVLDIVQIAQYLQIASLDCISGMMRENTEKTQKLKMKYQYSNEKGAFMLMSSCDVQLLQRRGLTSLRREERHFQA